jgi:hypothetical protein
MAFRSVPRPSSPPGAKASTECPSFARDHRAPPQGNLPRGKSPATMCRNHPSDAPDTAATRSAHNRIPIRQSRRRANADTPPNGTHAPERLRRRRWHPLAENTGQTLATAARPGTHQNLINTDKRTTVPDRTTIDAALSLHATRQRRNSLLLCDTAPAIGTSYWPPAISRQNQPMVETIGFEPTTPCLQSRCSPS